MEQIILDLYQMLHDDKMLQNAFKVVPSMKSGLQAVQIFLKTNAKAWISSACATFERFTHGLLETEPLFDKIIDNAPFYVAQKDDDSAAKVEWASIYASFVKPLTVAKDRVMTVNFKGSGDGCGEELKKEVHVSFVCMCGLLSQMCRQIHAFKILLSKSQQAPDFPTLLSTAIQARKDGDKKFVFELRSSLLDGVDDFGKMAGHMEQFGIMIADAKQYEGVEHDAAEAFFKALVNNMRACIDAALLVANGDVQDMVKQANALYRDIASRHAIPDIFQADPLNKQAIQALVTDAAGQQLALFAAKAAGFLTSTRTWVAGIRKVSLSQQCLILISALEQDIDVFQKSEKAEEDGKVTLAAVLELQINMTMGQAMVRDLSAGETRLGLINKCYEMAKNKGLQMDAALKKRALQMLKGTGR